MKLAKMAVEMKFVMASAIIDFFILLLMRIDCVS